MNHKDAVFMRCGEILSNVLFVQRFLTKRSALKEEHLAKIQKDIEEISVDLQQIEERIKEDNTPEKQVEEEPSDVRVGSEEEV